MTPKQILDSFSETLLQDERIISPQERALVITLLQHANAAAGQNPETQRAVQAVIASAVGETVAQRAFAVLGGSIVERILENGRLPQGDLFSARAGEISMGNPGSPSPGNPAPGPPSVKAPPATSPASPIVPPPGPPSTREPHKPAREAPVKAPAPPAPPPGPPSAKAPTKRGADTTVVSQTTVEVSERPPLLPAKCVVLDEFLSPSEVEELTRYTLNHEQDFTASEIVVPEVQSGIVNYEQRRSRVLMDLDQQQELILQRIQSVLPQVLEELEMEPFDIADLEAQITASNDGDFFHFHSDNGSGQVAARHLTFVYFFHREPRQFEGGDLRIHDSRLQDGAYVSEDRYQTIVPRQNQIVFFPCSLMHEITPVRCASRQFADSRFTLNGWLRH